MRACTLLAWFAGSVHLLSRQQQAHHDITQVAAGLKASLTRAAKDLDVALVQLEQHHQVTVPEIPVLDLDPAPHLAALQQSGMAAVRNVLRQAEHSMRMVRNAGAAIRANDEASARQSLNGLKASARHL